jgi:hypothetical protein
MHSGVIGVKGKAPFDLEWTMPTLTETAMMRLERRRMVIERKEKKAKKSDGPVEPEAQSDSEETTDSSPHTCANERDDREDAPVAGDGPIDSGETTDSPLQTFAQTSLHTFAETEEQEESPRINDEGEIDSPKGEVKEDLAPEPAAVGAASG